MSALKAIPVAVLFVSFLCGALALTCYECDSVDDASCLQTTVQTSWETIPCDKEEDLIGVPRSELRCLRAHYTEDNVQKVTRMCGREALCEVVVGVTDAFNISAVKCQSCSSDLCNV